MIWKATYVSVSEIKKDFENGTLDRHFHKFVIGEKYVQLVCLDTHEVLYEAEVFDILTDFVQLANLPFKYTEELAEKVY